jgi:hypothetical protein
MHSLFGRFSNWQEKKYLNSVLDDLLDKIFNTTIFTNLTQNKM